MSPSISDVVSGHNLGFESENAILVLLLSNSYQ